MVREGRSLVKRGYVDTAHGQIHYQSDGSGEPVLLLHRTPYSSDEYALVTPLLGKKYRAIAMDTLGYGNSDTPPHRYSMSDYARSVIDFLDALGINRTSLVGEHTGAGIAAEVAASYPDRVDRLILSGFPLFTEEELVTRRKGQVPGHSSKIEPLLAKADGSHMTDVWNHAKLVLGPADKPPEDIQAIAMAILKGGLRNTEAHLALWQYEPQERLPHIECPTLVLMSKEDQFYSRAEAIKNLIPRSRIVSVEGGGFIFPRQAPELYVETITAFRQNPGV